MKQITIKSLSKSYGQQNVLKDINASYESGIIYGLIGENGAGKTTFFNCIISNIAYEGTIVKDNKISIGYLPADLFFYSYVTGVEYIEFCIKANGTDIDRQYINELNDLFQLPLSKYAAEYSTGMKKKLAFMSLLLQNKDVYILDEPFNGIDLKGCILFKRIIRDLREKGRTFIISSHQIAALHEICDKIDYLSHKTFIKQFTTESIQTIEQAILED